MNVNEPRMELAVIIVSYNVSFYLDKCLKSLKDKLSGIRYEVVIIDNASRDDSVAMVKRKFPEFRLIETGKNIGFGRGVNAGAKMIIADNYLILNPDTVVTNDIIREMLEHLKQNPSAGIVGCRMLDPEGNIQPCVYAAPSLAVAILGLLQIKKLLNFKWLAGIFKLCARTSSLKDYVTPGHNMAHWKKVQSVPGSCFLMRGELFHQVGGYDEKIFLYFEDADLFFRVRAKKGWELHLLSNTGIIHMVGKSFDQEFYDISPRKYWSMLYYFWKNGRFWKYLVIRAILLFSALIKMLASSEPEYRNDCKQVIGMAFRGWKSFDPFPV